MPLKTATYAHAADPANYARFVLALVIVAALLFALKYLLQWFAQRQGFLGQGSMAVKTHTTAPRLEIVGQQAVDLKRRLVVVRWDNREFLLLLGTDAATIVAEQPMVSSSAQTTP